jgi:WD40 repeat protein
MTSEWEALVVGINRYPKTTTLNDLTVAAKDAEHIAVHLRDYGYQTFRVQCLPQQPNQKGEAQIHPTGTVTSQELQEALNNLLNPPPPNEPPETALFFFSGHGCRQSVDGKDEVFLVTSDVFPQARVYGLPLSWLGEQLQQSRVKRVMVWLDCCFSGELMKFQPTNKDFCFITATRSYEPGLEILHEQGLLTKTLLEGLNPKKYPDGIVTSHLLEDFIERRMPQTSQRPLIENSQRAILLTTKSPKRQFQNTCPYRSLSYFTQKPEDAEVFYGRSALTQELIKRVKQGHHCVAVLGASGSGKSSLLRAGLLYQLKLGQEIPGSDRWIYLEPFTPPENPLESLKEAIAKANPSPTPPLRGEGLSSSPFPSREGGWGVRFSEFTNTTIQSLAASQPVVMVIDQFEEAFTMCDEVQRKAFFDYLIELSQQNQSLYIFIGMRSDFRSRLREYLQLTEHINKPYINVGHLNREEIEEAIVKPAEWVGLSIEGALKQQIIHDVEDYPGSLPLLQYTLTELWNEAQKQGEQFLRLDTYEKLGGIEGTLQKRAEQVYQSLAQEEKTVAQRLFLELTQVGDTLDTRRRIYLDDLVNSHHRLGILNKVTQILASEQNRLITCTEEPTVEKTEVSPQSKIENPQSKIQIDVVHEALIRHWKRLRDWQDENREAMIVERDIETQAQQWQVDGKPNEPGMLLQGAKLAKAEDYLSKYGDLGMLDGVAEEFIAESQKLRRCQEQEAEERKQQELQTAQRLAQEAEARRKAEQKARIESENRAIEQTEANKKLRQRAWALGVASVVAVGVGITAIFLGLQASLREEAANIKLSLPSASATPLIQAIQTTGKSQSFLGTVLSEVYSSLYDAVEDVRERNSFSGHTDHVNAVAFSRDGKTVLSGSDDKTLKLWDTSGKLLQTFSGHQGEVRAVAFSPNSKTVLSGSKDNTLKLWDTSGNLLHTFPGHRDAVWAVAFSRDGKTVLSGSNDGKLKLWNTSGNLLHTFPGHPKSVSAVAFSPDGKTVLSGSWDNTLKLWDTSGKLLHTFTKHKDAVRAVAFSPDGKTVLSGSNDGKLKLWDTSGKLLKTLTGHQGSVRDVEFSPDGNTLLSGGEDNTLKLWDTSGKLLQTLRGHQNPVNAVAFSPKGKTLLSGSGDKTLKLWDTSGKLPKTFRAQQDGVLAVAFSPDGKTVLSGGGNNTLKLWNTSGNLLDAFKGHGDAVWAVAFSPDSKTLLSGSEDNTLKLWDTSGNLPKTFSKHQGSVWAVAFSRDGKTVLSSSEDKTLKLWDTSGNLLHNFPEHQAAVSAVAFSPKGNTLLSGSWDNTLKLWDTSGNLLHTFRGHQGGVKAVAFSPNGKTVLSGSWDSTLKLWNTSGKLLDTFPGHQAFVNAVAFSPDGNTVLSGSADNTLKLWDTSGKLLHTFREHQNSVNAVAFSPDGNTVLSGSWDDTLKLWPNPENWQYVLQLGCSQLRLHPLLASPDNDTAGKTCLQYGGWKETKQADFLVRQGKAWVQEKGDGDKAMQKLKQAQKIDPSLNLAALKTQLTSDFMQRGEELAKEGNVKDALTTYRNAQQFDPNLQISAKSWNNLCRHGSLNGSAKEVMFACEKAVSLAPNNVYIRDSRGIARALTGAKTGAIEDLQAFVNSPDISKKYKEKRQGWIKELKAGKNPFTDEVLQELRN